MFKKEILKISTSKHVKQMNLCNETGRAKNDFKKPNQSEGLAERINEAPWGRCLQGAVDVRWVVVVVVLLFCFIELVSSSPHRGRDSPPADL